MLQLWNDEKSYQSWEIGPGLSINLGHRLYQLSLESFGRGLNLNSTLDRSASSNNSRARARPSGEKTISLPTSPVAALRFIAFGQIDGLKQADLRVRLWPITSSPFQLGKEISCYLRSRNKRQQYASRMT